MHKEIIRFINMSMTRLPEKPGQSIHVSNVEFDSTMHWDEDGCFVLRIKPSAREGGKNKVG